ncbi:Eaf6p [Saccharomyces eubayanus]|uniref:Eaf6p n=1 Tax=Saccharomyces eubayanus TaxID=1080349 RepID=UPI0006BF2DF0|nr:EAF6-like protein [Saccharomyces eubayanus]KOG98663.1 EAF6-like protein [Saccharomyces eubayanus]
MTDELKQYEALKAELKKSLQDRKQQEDAFDSLQQEIYDKETEYFSHNSNNNHSGHGGTQTSKAHYSGNVIKGFDTFSKSHHSHADSAFSNNDRIFSLSSASYVKQQHNQAQSE